LPLVADSCRVVASRDGTSASTVRPSLLARLVGSRVVIAAGLTSGSSLSAVCAMEALVVGGVVTAAVPRFPARMGGSVGRPLPTKRGLMVSMRYEEHPDLCHRRWNAAPTMERSAHDALTPFGHASGGAIVWRATITPR